jgi:GT2 family glycosyltransferase
VSGYLDTLVIMLGSADLIARLGMCRRDAARAGRFRATGWIAVYGGGFAACVLLTGGPRTDQVLAVLAVVAIALAGRPALGSLHQGGYLSLAATLQFRVAAVAWLAHFAVTVHTGQYERVLLLMIAAAAVLMLPVLLLDTLLLQEAACRREWGGVPEWQPAAGQYRPRVSVHVPCYAEPPEVVKATLAALARLDYDAYEVVVIDNNTKDEALWRPVEAECLRLGDRFRFIHVDPLGGAKAGALNFALERTAPEVELIAVVDADYQAEPGFLADLVGAFGDSRLAFVQTSHDYRDWAHNSYQAGCYREYRAMYCGYMRSRSQRESALTTGTMCLVRRRALAQVGGWAEWCCTEDSELSVRLHAAGYTGRYVHRTYGRGLVPEKFSSYKGQRYRWIYGPTQEFRRHWRLFLPARWARPSALSPAQKLLFAHHGIRELVAAGASLAVTAAVTALALDVATGAAAPAVPVTVLCGLYAGAVSGLLGLWPLFRRVVGCSRAQALQALACRLALFDTRLKAGMAGWRSSSGAFRRTDKFPASADWVRALAGTARETVRGAAALVLAAAVLGANAWAGWTLSLPLASYLLLRAAGWLAAPALALSADRCLGPAVGGRVPEPTG